MKGFAAAVAIICALCVTPLRAENPVDEDLVETLRVVEDKDGQVNVRSAPDTTSKVLGKVASGGVVAVQEMKGEWACIWGETEGNRFVHGSRLRPVKEWKQTAGKAQGTTATVEVDSFAAKVTAVPFEKDKHKITKAKDEPERVDGKLPWGTDGGMPDKGLTLSVKLNGTPVMLPPEATANLYQPTLSSLAALSNGKPGEHVFVVMANSDGAGFYCVVWAFADGKYAGRAVFSQG